MNKILPTAELLRDVTPANPTCGSVSFVNHTYSLLTKCPLAINLQLVCCISCLSQENELLILAFLFSKLEFGFGVALQQAFVTPTFRYFWSRGLTKKFWYLLSFSTMRLQLISLSTSLPHSPVSIQFW